MKSLILALGVGLAMLGTAGTADAQYRGGQRGGGQQNFNRGAYPGGHGGYSQGSYGGYSQGGYGGHDRGYSSGYRPSYGYSPYQSFGSPGFAPRAYGYPAYGYPAYGYPVQPGLSFRFQLFR